MVVGLTAQQLTIRDSAGIRIVQHRGFDPAVVSLWRVELDPVLTIGMLEGPREHVLMNPLAAMVLGGGTIVIQDSYRGEFGIRYYQRDGSHLTTVSRWGQGPFEFHTLLGLHRLPGDSLLAVGSDGRFSVFGPHGGRVREGRLGVLSVMPLLRSELVDQNHLALWKPFGAPARPEGIRESQLLYLVKDLRGPIDTVAVVNAGRTIYESRQNGVLFYPFPFSARAHQAAGHGLLWLGESASGEVRGYNAEGALAIILRLGRPARRVTRTHRREFLNAMRAYTEPNPRWDYDEYAGIVEFPETLPFFGALETDRLGNLWVEVYDLPWSERNALWDVFAPDGEWLARVVVPFEIVETCARRLTSRCDQIREIGEDYILMTQRGPMGVRQVVKYRLRKL